MNYEGIQDTFSFKASLKRVRRFITKFISGNLNTYYVFFLTQKVFENLNCNVIMMIETISKLLNRQKLNNELKKKTENKKRYCEKPFVFKT